MTSAPRTVRELSDHPAVKVVSNETATQDGYWVYLKHGYVWDGTTSHVHEPTVKACCEAMADVRWDPVVWGHACGASDDEVAQLQRLRESEVTELREVKNAEGVHVPMAFSRRGRFEFSDSYSLCGAAACLDAAGWPLSEPVAALSRRWADLGQKPNPKGVAMARFYLGAVDNPQTVPASVDQVRGR